MKDKDLKLLVGGSLMFLGALMLLMPLPELLTWLKGLKDEEIKALQEKVTWLQEELKKLQES